MQVQDKMSSMSDWEEPYWLACQDLMSELIVDLLIQEDEAEHGPTHAPLIGTVLKQDNLKEGGQNLWQYLW